MVLDGDGCPIDIKDVNDEEVSSDQEKMEGYIGQCREALGADRETILEGYFESFDEAIRYLYLFIHPIYIDQVDNVIKMFRAVGVTKMADYEKPNADDMVAARNGKLLGSKNLQQNPYIILSQLGGIYKDDLPGGRGTVSNPGSSRTSGYGSFLASDAKYRGTQK